jgi:NAD(P) transhydrogenase subunit alpha
VTVALYDTPGPRARRRILLGSIVGALVVAGSRFSRVATILGFLAVTFATINVVGGFVITDRMLGMFKRGGDKEEAGAPGGNGAGPR